MVKEFVIDWFIKYGGFPRGELEENLENDYLALGIIDSFGFLELIRVCEEKFNVVFTDDDFSKNSMFSINGLIRLLETKINFNRTQISTH